QLIIKFSSAWSFLVPEILQIDEATIQKFIDENDDLERYKFDLKLINEERPHVLSADKERLLTEAQDALSTPDNVYGMFSNADLEFEDAIDSQRSPHSLTQGAFMICLVSDERALRRSAHGNLCKANGA